MKNFAYDYYNTIMEASKGSFSDIFNTEWNNCLSNFDLPYSNAIQIKIGNQLRPKLTCWGVALGCESVASLNIEKAAKLAVCIEMLHKASIIIDDLIDKDTARHGQNTFHRQFSEEETIIFALYLIGSSVKNINEFCKESSQRYKYIDVFSNTICKMAFGCLQELTLTHTSKYDIIKIRNIIDYETISLIRNSLLLGYMASNVQKPSIEHAIFSIGKDCGYIFQIMNDIEPFTSPQNNSDYKGNTNFDLNRNRKNIAVAYAYNLASKQEREYLLDLEGKALYDYMFTLYEKYAITSIITDEVEELKNNILNTVDDMIPNLPHNQSGIEFKQFILEMLTICYSRLGNK